MQVVHTPVMINECLSLLIPPERASDALVMCDSTLGEGGHTAAFLERYPNLHVIGIDRDEEQIKRAKERLSSFGDRVAFCNEWFDDYYEQVSELPSTATQPVVERFLPLPCATAEKSRLLSSSSVSKHETNAMVDYGRKVDIILFDLGISMFHYVLSGRGFSFQKDEPLDMRLDPSQGLSAADIVNGMREDEIADIIYKYGEERFSRRIAHAITESRRTTKITSAAALADIVYDAVPSKYRYGKIHPATRTFQALRIAVNGELERLERALPLAFDYLNEGGRMGVISFHSLEDRITKQFFRKIATAPCNGIASQVEQGGTITMTERMVSSSLRAASEVDSFASHAVLITRKGVKASESEVASNPPSRSATLRVLQKQVVSG